MSASDEDRAAPPRRLWVVGCLIFLVIGVGIGRYVWPQTSGETREVPVSERTPSLGGMPSKPSPDSRTTLAEAGAKPKTPSSLIENSNPGDLVSALRIPTSSLREAALLQAGFAMAKSDLPSAVARLDEIEAQSDRDAFLQGVFAFAASDGAVGEVFKLAAALEGDDRAAALYSALDALTGGREETRERAEIFSERFGVEAGVGMALSLDEIYRPEHAADWIAAFGDTDSAGVVIGSLASLQADVDFEKAVAMGAHLTDWDREMFFRAFGDGWSQRTPAEAWKWARQHAEKSGPGGNPLLATTLRNWSRKDFAAAEAAFNELTDPEQRRLAAHSLAQAQTWDSGTAEAVQWANQLPNEAEKDAAHAAIAEFSPQGIGVALELKDGFALINRVVPESVAARDGRLQQGDRIVEVDPGTGRFQNLYGRDLTQAINLIRGESGSRLKLRVIRQDESGNFRDQIVELTREQLVLEGS